MCVENKRRRNPEVDEEVKYKEKEKGNNVTIRLRELHAPLSGRYHSRHHTRFIFCGFSPISRLYEK